MSNWSFIYAAILACTVCVIADQEERQLFVEIFNNLHKPTEPLSASISNNVKTLWIKQKLDHFNTSETRTWQMRYMANDEFYKPEGPLFIFVGGEWSISAGTISSGHFHDMAKEHNGYLFYTEHRFYGESRPVDSLTNENLQYLDVHQALADLAHFIRTMKATISGMEYSRAILAGASYSASMVTWFRKLYPDLAAGCWASSAPLVAQDDFFAYKEIMGQSIKLLSSDTCYDRIKRGFDELESMFENRRGAEVKAMLQLCNSFDDNNDLDIFTLFYWISEIFASLVQTHDTDSIQTACAKIMAGSTDVIGLANYLVEKFGERSCSDFSYRSYLKLLTNSSFSTNSMRPWTYQTCNEFGWFQTSRSRKQPFGTKYPLVFFTTLCAHAYGNQYTSDYINGRLFETNSKFEGLYIEVENVYWTHGQLDPWRVAGMQNSDQSRIIPYHAHCKDFGSISERDSPELKASKEKIAALVRKWLEGWSEFE